MGIERKNEKVPVLPRFVSIKCACIMHHSPNFIVAIDYFNLWAYDQSWLGLGVLITGTSARQSTMSASVAAILMLILRGSTFNWTPEPELSSSQTGSRSQKGVSEATNLPPLRSANHGQRRGPHKPGQPHQVSWLGLIQQNIGCFGLWVHIWHLGFPESSLMNGKLSQK